MKKIYLLSFVVCILLFSSFVSAGELKKDLSDIIAKTPATEKISVIILFEDVPTQTDISVIKSDGANIKHQYKIINAVAIQVPAQAVDKIAKRASVKLVEPDYEVKLILDKSTSQIQADKVWQEGITGKNIDVAVIDTGVHDEHPSLTIKKEIDYTGEGTDDLHGHGTHVAGIVASTDPTYKGVAYDSDLFNVKVLNQYGSGSGSDVIKGIEWAVDNGAEVISMSLGALIDNCDGTDAISQAVDKAVSEGVIVVVAAGNSGPDARTITTPGCSKKGITVGAVDDNDNVPSWSSRGPTDDGRAKPDLVAPGVSITSTWKDNSFKSLSGSSMSTPYVSGVVTLLLETNSSLKPEDMKNVLKTTAIDLGLDENIQGAGRIDTYEAYLSLTNTTTEDPNNETNSGNETEKDEEKKSPPGLDRKLKEGRNSRGIGYGLTRAWEKISLAFTFNEEKEVELYLKFAERRLSESLEILEEDEEKARKLLEEYEENLERGNEISRIAQQIGKNMTKVTELVAVATSIHEETLKGALEEVPGQTRSSIERAINSSRRENEKSLNALKNSFPEKASELQFEIAERRLNQAREKARNGDSEEVKELIKEYEERINESERVPKNTSEHLIILGEIYNGISETAKPEIEGTIENSVRRREKDSGNKNEEEETKEILNDLGDPAKTKIKEVEERVKSENRNNAPNAPSPGSSSASGNPSFGVASSENGKGV